MKTFMKSIRIFFFYFSCHAEDLSNEAFVRVYQGANVMKSGVPGVQIKN